MLRACIKEREFPTETTTSLAIVPMAKIDPSVLRRLREAKGWTQNELSENTKFGRDPKIDKRTISRLERGMQASTHGRTIRQLVPAIDALCACYLVGL